MKDLLSQIKATLDLRRVIGQSIELKPQGKWYMGVCPFHPDTDPSLGVTKDFYYCFGAGCGAHGDVFTWLQQYHSLTFPEAVKKAAELAGIVLPDDKWKQAVEQANKARNELLEYLKQSREALWGDEGVEALGYLVAERQLTEDTIKHFQLGYDVRRRAIVIPLLDIGGHPVSFALRYLNGGSKRYIIYNRPGFRRAQYLYNMHAAIRGEGPLYVCEGYFDCMAIHQAGYPRVVALCGAQPNNWQRDWILRAAEHVVLVADTKTEDDLMQAYRNVQILRESAAKLRVEVVLPSGGDANATKPDELQELLAKPKPPELALIDVILGGADQAHQYTIARKLYEAIEDPLIRSDFIDELAKRWGKPVELVKQSIASGVNGVTVGRVVAASQVLEELHNYYRMIATGLQPQLRWPGFDHDMLGRIHTGHLVGIVARTNVGKTSYALNLLPWTVGENYSQLYVTLEQPIPEIMDRIGRITLGHICPEVNVNAGFNSIIYEIRRQRDMESSHVDDAIVVPGVRFADVELLVDTLYENVYFAEGARTIAQLKQLIAKTAETVDKPIKVVWIDFLGMMSAKGQSEYERLTNLVLGLSRIAKEFDILVIFLHQLSRRGGTGKQNVEIDMLRGSGQIEELVDLLLGLHRPKLEDDIKKSLSVEEFVVDVIKNRHGPKGRIKLTFYKTSLLITWNHPADGRPEVLCGKLQGILDNAKANLQAQVEEEDFGPIGDEDDDFGAAFFRA